MTFTQLITPNPNIPCMPGWCLQYVRQTFSLPAAYPTATAAWVASASKHRDRLFPKGVWFAVWFSLSNEPAGHVALMAPDGSVYSTSDLSNKPHHHLDLSDLMNYYGRYDMTLTYLGWTEDVAGYPVIAPAGLAAQGAVTPTVEGFLMALSDQDQAELLANVRKLVTASEVEKDFDAKVNEKVDELVNNARKTFWNTEESKIRLQNAEPAQVAAQIDAAGLASSVRDELVKLLSA